MTSFDLIILALLGIAGALGLWRGLVRELFGLVGILAALGVALSYGKDVYGFLQSWIDDSNIRMLVAYLAIFLIVLLGASLLSRAVEAVVAFTHLGFLDHVLGLAFGVSKAGVLIIFLFVLADFTPLPDQDWWKNARFKPWVELGVELSRPYWPEAFSVLVKSA